MDVYVLLDAIAKCMSSEESELNKVHTALYTVHVWWQCSTHDLEYMMFIYTCRQLHIIYMIYTLRVVIFKEKWAASGTRTHDILHPR